MAPVDLHVERRGKGPPLVCHPGGPGFGASYFGTLADLDRDVGLVLVDPRGCGRSPQATSFAFDDYVADLDALRERLGLDRIDLLGHSHGGMVAQAYAIARPDRVARLLLVNTAARIGPEQVAAMEAAMERRSDEPWYDDARAALEEEQSAVDVRPEAFGDLVRRELPFYFATWDERARAYADSLTRDPICTDALGHFNREVMTTFDHRPGLASITARTLVLTGADDFITGPDAAAEIADLVPGAELVVLPGVGHFSWVEDPAGFRDAVLGFLART